MKAKLKSAQAAIKMKPRLLFYIDSDRCAEFGLDPKRVNSIARRLAMAAAEASEMGLVVFGGSGSGSLRKAGGGCQNNVAYLGQGFDGGDGGDEY